MNVVLTAPRPTSSTPSLPSAGLISVLFDMAINDSLLQEFRKRYYRPTGPSIRRILLKNGDRLRLGELSRDQSFPKLSWSGSGGETKGLSKVTCAQITYAGSNLSH